VNELALFAGAGGGLLASKWLLGWRTVCYVENTAYPVAVLKARIRDGLLDDAPIWDDARTFDGRPWRGCVDIITAGFPCQPWAAGGKNWGEDDPRNLWPDTLRIIGETKPTWILLENSPNLLQFSYKRNRPPYIERIIAELARLGYVGRWGCLSAGAIGLDHKRRRLWIVAHATDQGREIVLRMHQKNCPARDAKQTIASVALESVWNRLSRLEERLGEPSVFGTDDGMAHRVDRLAAIGEGQVPAVVRVAWELLTETE